MITTDNPNQLADPGSGPHPGISPSTYESDRMRVNVPNAITAVRTVVAVCLAAAALIQGDLRLVGAAYAVYWIGDVLDGWSARLLRQETRFGAVFDILADRACFAMCASALMVIKPDAAIPCVVFLLQFLVLDCHLSLAFLRWPISSPNYFYLVHRAVYRWNWWPPAKVLNTTALVVAVTFSDHLWIAVTMAATTTVVKVVSLVVVSRIRLESTPGAPAGHPGVA